MDVLVNDLSLHGQFQDVPAFESAIARILGFRMLLQRYGSELRCHRNFVNSRVTPTLGILEVASRLERDRRLVLLQWLTKHGPFWDDHRVHGADDYLECNGDVVTDTAVGESGFCCMNGVSVHLASIGPSNWLFSPVNVVHVGGNGVRVACDVCNHWQADDLEASVRAHVPPIASWPQLVEAVTARCPNLTFTEDAFEPLEGHPFVRGASDQIVVLLETLDRLKTCFDAHGARTAEGQKIYQDHFTGDSAWFSDSSETEKVDYKNQLTFPHPVDGESAMFCTMHGKVRAATLRIHFSWPVRFDEPLYVAYVGPKITR